MRAAQYCADFRAVADAAEVLGPMRFALLGEVRDLTRNPVVDPLGREVRDPLLQALESELYRRLYCRPRPGGAPAGTDPAEERAFVGALSRANQGRGTWESGWRVAGVEPDGQIAVTKDQVTFWARPSQVRVSGGAGPQGHAPGAPEPGALCSVRLGKEIRHLFPAFYMALGNALPEGRPLLRLYWHLTPEAARAERMAAAFRERGLDPLCPYLEPGSRDTYTFEPDA